MKARSHDKVVIPCHCTFSFSLFYGSSAGEVNDAIDLYKTAINVLNESIYMALDDKASEKMRIDLAELLHAVGR